MAISMPGVDRVPEGPYRTFLVQLHLLYDSCGRPGARAISHRIRVRDDFRDTVSHETVASVLRGSFMPGWSKVECIVTMLSELSINTYDTQTVLRHFQALWLDAIQAQTGAVGSEPLTVVPEPTRVESRSGYAAVDARTDAFVAGLTTADRPAEVWICAYLRCAVQQLRELNAVLDAGAVGETVREACREKMLTNTRLLSRFLLVRSPREWTAWDFAPRWTPAPDDAAQRLRYWYTATTRYTQRMNKETATRYHPGSLDEFDVEGATDDCLAVVEAFVKTLGAAGSPYASVIDVRTTVAS